MYQGHLADGNAVQSHSAGSTYPFVVAVREHLGVKNYAVLRGERTAVFSTARAADKFAAACKAIEG